MYGEQDRPSAEIKIEWGTEVSLQFDRLGQRLTGTFVGLAPGRYLIVEVADRYWRELGSAFLFKSEVVCRYLSEGTACGFRCVFLDRAEFPAQLLFLSYPEKLEYVELRRHKRSSCYVPARLEWGEASLDGFLVDISEGGCRITVAEEEAARGGLEPGTPVSLRARLAGRGECRMDALVRSREYEPGSVALGLAFQGLTARDRSQVAQFILQVDNRVRERSFKDFQRWQSRRLPADALALYVDRYRCEVAAGGREAAVDLKVLAALDFQGRRTLLDASCGGRGHAAGWAGPLRRIRERGLERPLVVVSPPFPGLGRGKREVYPEADLQLSFSHLSARARRGARPEDDLAGRLRRASEADTLQAGMEMLEEMSEAYSAKYPELMREISGKAFEYLWFLHLPRELRSHFQDTSPLEPLLALLDGFRLSGDGRFGSRDEVRINLFWSYLRLKERWRRPLPSILHHAASLRERFSEIYGEPPRFE